MALLRLVFAVFFVLVVGCGDSVPYNTIESPAVPAGDGGVASFRARRNIPERRTSFSASRSLAQGPTLVSDGSVVASGFAGAVKIIMKSSALPSDCQNPGFELWIPNPVVDPLASTVLVHVPGLQVVVQIRADVTFPVVGKFFCELDGGMPFDMGGMSDPQCYTASLTTYFQELSRYDADGGVVDLRLGGRAFTYIGKFQASSTGMPLSFCVDGGQ